MEEKKLLLAVEIAKRVKDGDLLAVGAGSTVQCAISVIGERIKKESLRVSCVTSSLESAWSCQAAGFNVLSQTDERQLAWGFDGADAVDNNLQAIKGKGGAMLQEKILAERCNHLVLLVTKEKIVNNLAVEQIPIEIIPIAYSQVLPALKKLGAQDLVLRSGSGKAGPVITEKGNIIIDAKFSEIKSSLEKDIKSITGVVESGLFQTQAAEVLLADGLQIQSLRKVKTT